MQLFGSRATNSENPDSIFIIIIDGGNNAKSHLIGCNNSSFIHIRRERFEVWIEEEPEQGLQDEKDCAPAGRPAVKAKRYGKHNEWQGVNAKKKSIPFKVNRIISRRQAHTEQATYQCSTIRQ
jgi:hypothetical protein